MILIFLCFLFSIISLLAYILVNATVYTAAAESLFCLVFLFIHFNRQPGLSYILLVCALLCLLYILCRTYIAYVISLAAGTTACAACYIAALANIFTLLTPFIIFNMLFASYVVFCFIGFITAINPKPFVHFVQRFFFDAQNLYVPSDDENSKLIFDHKVYRDVRYSDKYPNSFMDIHITDYDPKHAPTLFYIHGGGYSWGDKAHGDSNTRFGNLGTYFTAFIYAGFNIVSPNYAYSPDYTYPTPLIQLSEAISFLKDNADKYGLDMTRIVMAGESAGGQIAGQLTSIQLSANVAEEAGVTQVLSPDNIKAVVFNSSLLNSERFAQTHDFIKDYLFNNLGRAYYRAGFLKNHKNASFSSILNLVNENFPPCFISDGNFGTFFTQAAELNKTLDELYIKHIFNYYDKSVALLRHGFEVGGSQEAVENMTKTIDFLKGVLSDD